MIFVMQAITELPDKSEIKIALIANKTEKGTAIIKKWSSDQLTALDLTGMELHFPSGSRASEIPIVDPKSQQEVAKIKHAEPSYAFLRTKNPRMAEEAYHHFIAGTFCQPVESADQPSP